MHTGKKAHFGVHKLISQYGLGKSEEVQVSSDKETCGICMGEETRKSFSKIDLNTRKTRT